MLGHASYRAHKVGLKVALPPTLATSDSAAGHSPVFIPAAPFFLFFKTFGRAIALGQASLPS